MGRFVLLSFASAWAFAPKASVTPFSHHLFAEKEKESVSGHQTGGDVATLPEKVQEQMNAYRSHQQGAATLDFATDVRTLVQYNHGYAVLSTHSVSYPEYPSGSVVGFAPDDKGRALFCFSTMSSHTTDIEADPHCSLTVAAKQFKGAADGRVTLTGRAMRLLDEEDVSLAREDYMKKHPGAFWTSFGDFHWYRMEVDYVRFVGGFARAGSVTADEYSAAKPDPIAEFGPSIAEHMNDDHMEATMAIVKATVPGMDDPESPDMTEAIITTVDSLGMFVKVTRTEGIEYLPASFKCRVPFPRVAADRKDIKTLIVEMTQAASSK